MSICWKVSMERFFLKNFVIFSTQCVTQLPTSTHNSVHREKIFLAWMPFKAEWSISICDSKALMLCSLPQRLKNFFFHARRFGMTRQLSVLIRNSYQSINSFMKTVFVIWMNGVLLSTSDSFTASNAAFYWFLNFPI